MVIVGAALLCCLISISPAQAAPSAGTQLGVSPDHSCPVSGSPYVAGQTTTNYNGQGVSGDLDGFNGTLETAMATTTQSMLTPPVSLTRAFRPGTRTGSKPVSSWAPPITFTIQRLPHTTNSTISIAIPMGFFIATPNMVLEPMNTSRPSGMGSRTGTVVDCTTPTSTHLT